MIHLRAVFIALYALLLLLAGQLAYASVAIEDLAKGSPTTLGTALGSKTYVKVTARRLTGARLVWVNLELLRERGVPIPPEGLTPQLEQAILKAFAFGIPGKDEPESAFGPEEKIFFADRYGGSGVGDNFGSGRAASSGEIQIKGIGKTPLVANQGDDHSNGFAPLEEAVREAIWGEINRDLPHGSNRVIAVIDRGTTTRLPNGTHQCNTLIVRENAVRPAHFLANFNTRGRYGKSDPARLNQNAKLLEEALPVPAQYKGDSRKTRISAGLFEFATRVAQQYAAAFARMFYHGATSPSNIELSGKFLDFGTQTALPGYPRLRIIDNEAPSGSIAEVRKELITGFLRNLKADMPPDVARTLPTGKEFAAHFDTAYAEARTNEFSLLAGAPPELAQLLAPTLSAQNLAKVLEEVAVHGAKQVKGRYQVPEQLNTYDLGAILNSLAAAKTNDRKSLSQALETEFPQKSNPELHELLLTSYQNYMAKLYALGWNSGFETASLKALIRANTKTRNARHPELYRWKMMDLNFELIHEYEITHDPSAIRASIDRRARTGEPRCNRAHVEQLLTQ